MRETQIRNSMLNRNVKRPAQSEVFRRTMGQVSRNYWATVGEEERRERGKRVLTPDGIGVNRLQCRVNSLRFKCTVRIIELKSSPCSQRRTDLSWYRRSRPAPASASYCAGWKMSSARS